MTTLYNTDNIRENDHLLSATVSKLFVDFKDTSEKPPSETPHVEAVDFIMKKKKPPHAEFRLVLAQDNIDRWNCSMGSNPGAVVNSQNDITIGVRTCQNLPANILISFEFRVRVSGLTLRGLLDLLCATDLEHWENLFQFNQLGLDLRGSRDLVFQWLLRLERMNIINRTADGVADTSRLGILGQPELQFGKFIAKDYSNTGWGVIQSASEVEIHRGWFEFEALRARGSNDTPHPYVSLDEDVDHKAKSGA
ncbi:unnamed protein product [Clonostachys byssicola]|uniref:Uncharacterized protein n=1 Tax=Clonostachys byssicola TaxID=160290 RepID=A0A9N9UBX4_9HYPO|nr:unnamed protein product [Clonostachys byssicola]